MQTVSFSLGDSLHEMPNAVFSNKTEKKIFRNVVCWFFYFDCATGMCNYYFCNHLMKYCKDEKLLEQN